MMAEPDVAAAVPSAKPRMLWGRQAQVVMGRGGTIKPRGIYAAVLRLRYAR